MSGKMKPSRGRFDCRDDEPDTSNYASSLCYMNNVHPSHLAWVPSTRPMSARKPNGPEISANVILKARVLRNKIVACAKFEALIRKLFQTIGRHAATQIERVEARRKVRALARLRARTDSKR